MNVHLKVLSILTALLCATCLIACIQQSEEGVSPVSTISLDESIRALQHRKIYFGHQSVGTNIVQGIRDILSERKSDALSVITLKDTSGLPEYYFAESAIGVNRNVQSKCDAFGERLRTLGGKVDIAFMKLCFVDITHETDADSMFAIYARAIDSLRKEFPSTHIVHVTVPLTVRTAGWKRWVKQLLGREDIYELGNMQRSRFNDLLLARYGTDVIFDLARLESTAPDGSRVTYDLNGSSCYAIYSGYTDDGGHLNVTGRRKAAEVLLQTLATIK